jgi:hypothetical protein
MLNDTDKKKLSDKYAKLETKLFSNILNLDSNSKEWQRASRTLSRLRKTFTYKNILENNY